MRLGSEKATDKNPHLRIKLTRLSREQQGRFSAKDAPVTLESQGRGRKSALRDKEQCSSVTDRFRPLKSNKQMTKIVKSIHKNYAES